VEGVSTGWARWRGKTGNVGGIRAT